MLKIPNGTFLFILLVFSSCSNINSKKLFILKDGTATGLTFKNQIFINDSLNAVSYEYIYNGGGAAVGDVNNDGLSDLFFAGNMVSSHLYLNKGELRFEDITGLSGTETDRWCTGVSMTDINNDGLLDIYLSVAGPVSSDLRRNIFFINKGIDHDGIHILRIKPNKWASMMVGTVPWVFFFDFDKDQDLDLYLLTNSMEGINRNMIRPIIEDGSAASTDRLYRNEGDEIFENISEEAGILIEGHGLGISLCDINQDTWTDIYCANDFISNDLLWINNQDGTFTEQAGNYLKHFTNNGMGMDIADFNNDGLIDIVELDMMPFTNVRQKLMFVYRNMGRMKEAVSMGFLPQFMRNTLQLNLGKFPDGQHRFSEIGYLAGIYQTDWSWAPLLVDFDNDGWKDLLITNGYRKDVTNLDYINEIIRKSQFGTREYHEGFIVDAMNGLPDVKLPNFIYKNSKDLTFEDKSEEWGLDIPTFSNGTITADLDNDGDMDIVVNNIDQEVFLFENRLNNKVNAVPQNHFLKLNFENGLSESQIVGAKFWIFQKDQRQYIEYSPYRGYKSSVDRNIHVGLGAETMVDSIVIQWPDGMIQKLSEIRGDSTIELHKSGAQFLADRSYIENLFERKSNLRFKDITGEIHLDFKHEENLVNDLLKTPSLIRQLSMSGPSISVGDVNMDGLDDVFIGSDRDRKPVIFFQHTDHTFMKKEMEADSHYEDMGSLFFDADGDQDLDLYVVSGGSAWHEDSDAYQDRLYMNDGSGKYVEDSDRLPEIRISGSCVIASDYDMDGDLDLFVGGRLVPNKYPISPRSYLLENEDGDFIDKSELLGDQQGLLGMTTSALWTDVNNDNTPDLIVVGEWMQITVLLNTNNSFVDKTKDFDLLNTSGWWNSINGGDFDNDGDIDYLVGNYGLNSFFKATVEKPVEIYAKDFDNNGFIDPIVTHYIQNESYIVHPRNTIIELIPSIENRFFTFESYGNTPFKNSFTSKEIVGATHLTCKMMQSVILENVQGKKFIIHELPKEVQFSPAFGTHIDDFNFDNRPDIMIVGNSYADETVAGYYDASYGNVLINKGNFQWEVQRPSETNFIADGDIKALAKMIVNDQSVYLISENDGYLQAYTVDTTGDFTSINFEQLDWYFTYELNGMKFKNELYHGSGFLSSSTRSAQIPTGVHEIEVFKYNGESRIQFFK